MYTIYYNFPIHITIFRSSGHWLSRFVGNAVHELLLRRSAISGIFCRHGHALPRYRTHTFRAEYLDISRPIDFIYSISFRHNTTQAGTTATLTDARPASCARTARNSRKRSSCATGGSMCAAICRPACTRSMHVSTSNRKWIRHDRIASSPSNWSRTFLHESMCRKKTDAECGGTVRDATRFETTGEFV